MKLIKADLEQYRKERYKSALFLLTLTMIIGLFWPTIKMEFDTPEPLLTDLTYHSYNIEIKVDDDGTQYLKETADFTLSKKQTYSKVVGSSASNDTKVRYLSQPVKATLDGKEVPIKTKLQERSSKLYEIGGPISGRHTIEFEYKIPNGIVYKDGAPVLRSRLFYNTAYSQTENFSAKIEMNGIDTESAVCWMSNRKEPQESKDCDFAALTETEATVVIDELPYFTPVRVVVPLDNDITYEVHSTWWSSYWDSMLTPYKEIPFIVIGLALGIFFLMKRYAVEFKDKSLVIGTLSLSFGLIAYMIIFHSFRPSIFVLPVYAALITTLPAYLRLTEKYKVMTTEEYDEYVNKDGVEIVSETKTESI